MVKTSQQPAVSDFGIDQTGLTYLCQNCGNEMSPFTWGIKNVDTCQNCGFKHPCCE